MIGSYAAGTNAVGELAPGDAYTPAIEALYYSLRGYTTEPGDDPPSQHYEERVTQPLQFYRSILGARIGGLAAEQAEIRLANTDGALDGFLTSYAFDHREVSVHIGEPDYPLIDFGSIFTGVMGALNLSEDEVAIEVQTNAHALEAPISLSIYAGSGSTEGGADLAGTPKPLCWGRVYNVPAVPVDRANLVYQVHDGRINDILEVRDNGIVLTEVGGTPSAGQWQADLTNGRFTLGASPAGLVTCDVEGRHDGTSYLSSLADIVADIVANFSTLSAADVDTAALADLDADQPAPVGLWIGDMRGVSVRDVLDDLLAGAGCYGFFTLAGKLKVGQLRGPAAPHDLEIDADSILALRRDPLPADLAPAVWRWRVGYRRAHAVQAELASAASAAAKAFAGQAWRFAAATDSGVQAAYVMARDPDPQLSPFADAADAEDEAERQLAIYGQARSIFVAAVKPALWLAEIGQVALITHPRYGLASGAYGVVVALDLSAADNTTEVTLLV